MLVCAYCNIDRSREHGIERFPAAFEIDHCDGKSVVAEVAAPFRDRHRQIIEMRLVGDSELERGAFKLLPVDQTGRDRAEQQTCHTRGESPTVILQFCHGATEELAVPPEHRTVQAILAIANAAESGRGSGSGNACATLRCRVSGPKRL